MSGKTKLFYEFSEFRLDPDNPSLWRAGKPVSISPKALETLILLVKRRSETVSRDELLATVWRDTFVEEGNINYTISLLRKTLDDKDLIQTVPRRGYRFIGEVREIAETDGEKNSLPAETEDENSFPPAAAAPLPVPPEIRRKSSTARWLVVSFLLIAAIALSGFAYLLRAGKTTVPPEKNLVSSNPEAMQAYTRGKMILTRRAVEKRTEKAIDEFQTAVTLDPTFALAYAGLAEGFASTAVKETFPASGDFYAKAKIAAEKSLALDPNLAEGYIIRGWIKRSADWDWTGAESDLRRAVQLNSKNAAAHQRLAQLLCSLGRLDEALSEIKIAYELDPLTDYIVSARFPILEARREYDAALKESEKLMRENKSDNNGQRAAATFYYHTGSYERVIELGENALAKETPLGEFAWLSLLHAAYQKTNRFEKAEEHLKRLEALAQTDTKALYSLTMNYAELGRADEALMNLERCFKEREERMAWIKVEPRFENLRGDERFARLLEKMNLKN